MAHQAHQTDGQQDNPHAVKERHGSFHQKLQSLEQGAAAQTLQGQIQDKGDQKGKQHLVLDQFLDSGPGPLFEIFKRYLQRKFLHRVNVNLTGQTQYSLPRVRMQAENEKEQAGQVRSALYLYFGLNRWRRPPDASQPPGFPPYAPARRCPAAGPPHFQSPDGPRYRRSARR